MLTAVLLMFVLTVVTTVYLVGMSYILGAPLYGGTQYHWGTLYPWFLALLLLQLSKVEPMVASISMVLLHVTKVNLLLL